MTVAELSLNSLTLEQGEPEKEVLIEREVVAEQEGAVEERAAVGQEFAPDLNKRLIDTFDGFKVFLVNGEYVRNNFEIDFTMGSHFHVSSYIPEGEVWLDDRLSENDLAALVCHEIHELKLMKEGMEYEKAHELATKLEIRFRKKLEEIRLRNSHGKSR